MNMSVKKQFMLLDGYPLLYYSLRTFQLSFIDEITVVTSAGDEDYVREDIIERYGFDKAVKVVTGGSERYLSVYEGLKAAGECDYIFIHDCARAFVTEEILKGCLEGVREYGACTAAVPCKDTIKLSDEDGFFCDTPDRSRLWQIQTPQVFEYGLIRDTYEELIPSLDLYLRRGMNITDDTMLVEELMNRRVHPSMGSYNNIKVTTPEDVILGEAILKAIK